MASALAALPACGVEAESETDASSGNAVSEGQCSGGMCRIASGVFQMGFKLGDSPSERNVRSMRVEAFDIDQFEVTVAKYEACVAAGDCTPAGGRSVSSNCNAGVVGKEQHPINCVDRSQALAYCKKQGKRLPTETEWEFAARGSSSNIYPWGNNRPDKESEHACWARDKGATQLGTCAVGSFPKGKTPIGVQDMSGNVSEWTDEFKDRGGSWRSYNADHIRGSFLSYTEPGREQRVDIGFRCVR